MNDAWSSMMHHDTGFIGVLLSWPGGVGAKILPPESCQTCWEEKWARKWSPWEPRMYRLSQNAQFFEAKPTVTMGGRQTPYFGSKRPVSGSTFSIDFWWIFGVPLTNEKTPHGPMWQFLFCFH